MVLSKVGKPIIYLVLLIFSMFFLLPVYMVITITSLKPIHEVSLDTMWSLPSVIDLSSYSEAFNKLAPNFLNTLYLVIPATLLSALLVQ